MNILFKYYYDKNDRKDLQVSEQILGDFSTMKYLCTKSLHSKKQNLSLFLQNYLLEKALPFTKLSTNVNPSSSPILQWVHLHLLILGARTITMVENSV